jgi:RNA polymerase sigma factor (sigma-70 family)
MADRLGRHPGRDGFPITRLSVIEALRSAQHEIRSRAFDHIVAAYWKPIYKYVRTRYRQSVPDAQDFTQGFFTRVLEKDFLASFDPGKARLRTFLRVCLDRYIANEFKSHSRFKRGGDCAILSLDFAGAERELQRARAVAPETADDYFEHEWLRSVMSLAIEKLRQQTSRQQKELHFRLFEQYDLEPPEGAEKITYRQLAQIHGLAPTDVTNYLADMRRQFRSIVLEIIRELTASEAEFRHEVRAILGVDR